MLKRSFISQGRKELLTPPLTHHSRGHSASLRVEIPVFCLRASLRWLTHLRVLSTRAFLWPPPFLLHKGVVYSVAQLVQAAKRVLTKSMGHNGTYQWTKVRDSPSLWQTFSFAVREPVSWCAISQAVWRCSAFSRSNKFDNSPVLPTGWLYLSKEDTWRAKTTGNFSHSHTSGKLLQSYRTLEIEMSWQVRVQMTGLAAKGYTRAAVSCTFSTARF